MATKEEWALYTQMSRTLYNRGTVAKSDDYLFWSDAIAFRLSTCMYVEQKVTLYKDRPASLWQTIKKAVGLSHTTVTDKATIRLINDPELHNAPFFVVDTYGLDIEKED